MLVLNSIYVNVSCPAQVSVCTRKADGYYVILSINCIETLVGSLLMCFYYCDIMRDLH